MLRKGSRAALLVAGLSVFSASVSAEISEAQREEIANRIAPIGSVCVEGASSCPEPARPGATAMSTGALPGAQAVDAAEGSKVADGAMVVASAGAAVDGEAVYNQACAACHNSGVGGAPMLGDVDQWSERLAKGRDALHQSGLKGVAGTAMMAKGGRADLSDQQVLAAVDYMIESSGGETGGGEAASGGGDTAGSGTASADSAPEAEAGGDAMADSGAEADAQTVAMAETHAAIDGEAIYNQACMACHMSGVGGAPKLGDSEAWAPRIAKGADALYASGLNGVQGTAMMAKGGRADLSDAEVKAAVDYMIAQAQ